MEAVSNSTPTPTNADTWAATLANLASELVQSGEANARENAARRIGAVLNEALQASPALAKPPAAQMMNFTAASGVYALAPDACADDVHAQLSARLSHLAALLQMTMGAGFEAFTNYNATTQENYLWTCSTLADECEDLLDALGTLNAKEREATAQ